MLRNVRFLMALVFILSGCGGWLRERRPLHVPTARMPIVDQRRIARLDAANALMKAGQFTDARDGFYKLLGEEARADYVVLHNAALAEALGGDRDLGAHLANEALGIASADSVGYIIRGRADFAIERIPFPSRKFDERPPGRSEVAEILAAWRSYLAGKATEYEVVAALNRSTRLPYPPRFRGLGGLVFEVLDEVFKSDFFTPCVLRYPEDPEDARRAKEELCATAILLGALAGRLDIVEQAVDFLSDLRRFPPARSRFLLGFGHWVLGQEERARQYFSYAERRLFSPGGAK